MFAAVGVMGGIMFVVSLVRAFSTEQGQELTRGYSEVANLVVEAQTAPGADKLASLSQTTKAGDHDGGKRGPEKTMVTCQVGFAKAPPECQALAQVYVKAARPTAPFRVAVQKQGDPNRTCDRVFDEKGQPVLQTPEATPALVPAPGDAAALPPTMTVPAPAASSQPDGGAH
jgi:hypothetical protein